MKKLILATVLGGLMSSTAMAAEQKQVVPSNLVEKPSLPLELMAATGGKIKVESAVKSPIQDATMITLEDGTELHLSGDKKYFIVGTLFKSENGKIVDLSAKNRASKNIKLLHELSDDDKIVFKEKGEYKGQIWVFTDPTCKFCKKLHKEVPELNENGIRVNYITWPRAEAGSKPYTLAQQIACSEDQVAAMDTLKNGGTINTPACDDHNIEELRVLGAKMGLRGTPYIVFDNGESSGGYSPARTLIKAVEEINSNGALN